MKKARQKFARNREKILSLHKEVEILAEVIPPSGDAANPSADLRINHALDAVVRSRGKGQGFVQLNNWLGNHDLLFLNADYQSPLVVMKADLYTRMLNASRNNRQSDPSQD